jgi:hypothetical protein
MLIKHTRRARAEFGLVEREEGGVYVHIAPLYAWARDARHSAELMMPTPRGPYASLKWACSAAAVSASAGVGGVGA